MRLLSIACLVSVAAGFVPASINSASRTAVSTVSRETPYIPSINSATQLNNALLVDVDLGKKYYPPKEKEVPKVLGGVKIGLRKLVVITGASSGLGLATAKVLAKTGRYFVVMACRDVEKAKRGKVLKKLYSEISCEALFLMVVLLQLPRTMDSQTILTPS